MGKLVSVLGYRNKSEMRCPDLDLINPGFYTAVTSRWKGGKEGRRSRYWEGRRSGAVA